VIPGESGSGGLLFGIEALETLVASSKVDVDFLHQFLHAPALVIAGDIGVQIAPDPLKVVSNLKCNSSPAVSPANDRC
jgi:hypothetical protein